VESGEASRHRFRPGWGHDQQSTDRTMPTLRRRPIPSVRARETRPAGGMCARSGPFLGAGPWTRAS